MISSLFEHLPNWAFFIIIPALALTVLWVINYLFRRYSNLLGFDDLDTDILDTATQNAMSIAGVILGFVLVLVMETANNIDGNVATEASQIDALDRAISISHAKGGDDARKTLYLYTKSIIEDEWPKLSKDGYSEKTMNYSRELSQRIEAMVPETPRQIEIFREVYRRYDEVLQSRNIRILSAQTHLPSLFWQVSWLIMLGILIIAALRLLKPSPAKVVTIAVQVSMVSILLTVVMILDLPFMGAIQSSPEPIGKVVELLEKRQI